MNPTSLLSINHRLFSDNFNRRPFKIQHELSENPLFQLERLTVLCEQLTEGNTGGTLYSRGDVGVNVVEPTRRTFVDRALPTPDLSKPETISKIEEAEAWMHLRDTAKDPDYDCLLNDVFAEFRPLSEPLAPHSSHLRGDVFVTSPGSTTPYHMDEEHNFLLQIRGNKTVHVANGLDPEALSVEQLTDFYAGRGELCEYHEELEQLCRKIELRPGEGLHIPPCHPHWVQNGGDVSISYGIVWLSDWTKQRRNLYKVNRWLSAVGLPVAAPGQHPLIDKLKTSPFSAKRRAAHLIGRTDSI